MRLDNKLAASPGPPGIGARRASCTPVSRMDANGTLPTKTSAMESTRSSMSLSQQEHSVRVRPGTLKSKHAVCVTARPADIVPQVFMNRTVRWGQVRQLRVTH